MLEFVKLVIKSQKKAMKPAGEVAKYQDFMQYTRQKKTKAQKQIASESLKFTQQNKKNQVQVKQSLEEKLLCKLTNG